MKPNPRNIALIVFFLLVFLCFKSLAFSQTEKKELTPQEQEMQMLRMFFSDKELVATPSRYPKSVSRVAENVTVITAEEIEKMNAHSVADVLNRVPGLFLSWNQEFGSNSLIFTQGSESRHVLVVFDGVPWNFLNSGHAEVNTIPIGVIDRIEIIKGPGSSVWGSSLGGVINIITKQAGGTKKPYGNFAFSGGEEETHDLGGYVKGKAGPIGYLLYADRKSSNGLKDNRDFETYNLYSKFTYSFTPKIYLDFTIGYSEPKIDYGPMPMANLVS